MKRPLASPVGLKVLPRTIKKEQDARLRELVEKTGRKIPELVRGAVENFPDKKFLLDVATSCVHQRVTPKSGFCNFKLAHSLI